MKRFLLVLLLSITILNNGYSSEEDVFYSFFVKISNEMQRVRELFIIYYTGVYNDEELKIIENEIKDHLSNISLNIESDKFLIENDILLMKIFEIIDYELNNKFNINFKNNSYEMIGKIDLLLEMMMLAYIFNYYEP